MCRTREENAKDLQYESEQQSSMSRSEALSIILELAENNFAPSSEMPEEFRRQYIAYDIVHRILGEQTD